MAGPRNLPLFFIELLTAGLLIDRGAKAIGASLQGGASASGPGAGVASAGTLPAGAVSGYPAGVNPVPGATGSRLDQGFDATGSTFLAPWDGKVVYESASDPGWDGGGYVAIQSAASPSKVYYVAEGITPTVALGDVVKAGQKIATPRSNPYNGIVGNVEFGLADPSSPGRPLAQVVGNASQMVLEFAHWIEQLGGPTPSSTSDAGHA